VVQLYVGDLKASVSRPIRELRAFTKVRLEPGASDTITFVLSDRDLCYWSIADSCWQLEAGEFEIAVGASSRDLRLRVRLEVPAPRLPGRLDGMTTLREWLAHPEGSTALREAIGRHPGGRPRGILADQHLMTVIGDFPISSLATFPGTGLTNATVADLVQRFQPTP
jgi:beta-glucosidase